MKETQRLNGKKEKKKRKMIETQVKCHCWSIFLLSFIAAGKKVSSLAGNTQSPVRSNPPQLRRLRRSIEAGTLAKSIPLLCGSLLIPTTHDLRNPCMCVCVCERVFVYVFYSLAVSNF